MGTVLGLMLPAICPCEDLVLVVGRVNHPLEKFQCLKPSCKLTLPDAYRDGAQPGSAGRPGGDLPVPAPGPGDPSEAPGRHGGQGHAQQDFRWVTKRTGVESFFLIFLIWEIGPQIGLKTMATCRSLISICFT